MKTIISLEGQQEAIATLVEAFAQNKSVRQITGRKDNPKKLRRLIRYALEECREFGKVLSDDSGRAFALVIYPDLQKTTFASLRRTLYFICRIAGLKNSLKAFIKENELKSLKKAHFVSGRFYYLWFIGLRNKDQGRGLGTALLREIMADAKRENRKLLLETSTETNLPFYWKAGLECYDVLKISFPIYCFHCED